MKTAKIHGLKPKNAVQNTRRLVNSQTKSGRIVSGPSQPVVPNKVEPAVFDIAFIKATWNRFINNFRSKC